MVWTSVTLAFRPCISSHSKPCTRSRIWRLNCFVLEHSVFKTKHFRCRERDLVQGFEWLEILGFFVTNSVHHLPIIMELSWYALPSSWMKGQKSTMQVSYSFSFPHDFCTVKFSSHLSQFFIIKSSRRIFYYLLIHRKYFFCIKYSFS